MTNFQKKINGWNSQYKNIKDSDSCRSLLWEMHEFDETEEISIVERIVLLINQCIIIDAIGDDSVEINNVDFSRNEILDQIQLYFEEYNSSSLIDELNCANSTAFKERIAFLVALLLYKVHNYEDAAELFKKSRSFSAKLSDSSNPNGLNNKLRIQRDIYYTYCCEYKGTHVLKREDLIKAIKILIGDDGSQDYWERFKKYCFEKLYAEEIWTEKSGRENNVKKAIEIITNFAPDNLSVFSRLIGSEDTENEYREAIHAFAHCLNEINSILSSEREMYTPDEAISAIEERSFIRFLSRQLIDSLGENYATCQSTIRAEQGRIRDAINIMHQINQTTFDDADVAELDFYQYYYETLFFEHLDLENELYNENHGAKFYSYCEKNKNNDNGKDGLLHFHIVSLRYELKQFVENVINSEHKDETFLSIENSISHSSCYKHYEYLRKNHFSVYANSQIVSERERLINVYKVIRSLQSLGLPLVFDANAPYDEKINIKDAIEELYEMCHKVNLLINKQKEGDCSGTSSTEDDNSSSECLKVCVDGILLEVHGKYDALLKYLNDKGIKYFAASNKQSSLKQILVIDEHWYQKCLELLKQYERSNYHIYYVYDPKTQSADKENFNGTSIVALQNVDLCFLFSYIYASVEKIVYDTLNPEPIYILVPLKNTSTYMFQGAVFTDLVNCPVDIESKLTVLRGGMGIRYRRKSNTIVEKTYELSFLNDNVRKSCVNILKYKDNRLYVLRGEKLVPKTRINNNLLLEHFSAYSFARKNSLPKAHPKELCQDQSTSNRCCCVYCEINDFAGDFTLSKQGLNAGSKLKRLLWLACEEDNIWSDHLFVLEGSYTVVSPKIERDNGTETSFQICLFNRDIRPFTNGKCFNEVVTIKDITNAEDNKESNSEKTTEKKLDDSDKADEDMIKKKRVDSWAEDVEKLIHKIDGSFDLIKSDSVNEQLRDLLLSVQELQIELIKTDNLESWRNKFVRVRNEVEQLLKVR